MRDPAKKADEIVDTYNSRDPELIAGLCGILINKGVTKQHEIRDNASFRSRTCDAGA